YEALSNVRKHADDAPASVRVVWREDALGLQVRDTGTRGANAAGEGRGIPERRTRAELHGGELRAEGLPSGGFEVVARLPLGRLATGSQSGSPTRPGGSSWRSPP